MSERLWCEQCSSRQHHATKRNQQKKDEAAASDAFWLAALAAGCVAGSASLWYYSRRYVGELALLLPKAGGAASSSTSRRNPRAVRLSVLDFWGNREVRCCVVLLLFCVVCVMAASVCGAPITHTLQHTKTHTKDNDVALSALRPPFKGLSPAALAHLTAQLLFPLDAEGDRQYYLSVPAGELLHKEVQVCVFLRVLFCALPAATDARQQTRSSTHTTQTKQPLQSCCSSCSTGRR